MNAIRTKSQYEAALKKLSTLFDQQPNPRSPEGHEFEVLSILVHAYEEKHFPIDLPDPIEAIKFKMEKLGLEAKDLVPMIGAVNRVHEVLNRTRPLTLPMMWKIRDQLKISGDILLNQAAVRVDALAARKTAVKAPVSKQIPTQRVRAREHAIA